MASAVWSDQQSLRRSEQPTNIQSVKVTSKQTYLWFHSIDQTKANEFWGEIKRKAVCLFDFWFAFEYFITYWLINWLTGNKWMVVCEFDTQKWDWFEMETIKVQMSLYFVYISFKFISISQIKHPFDWLIDNKFVLGFDSIEWIEFNQTSVEFWTNSLNETN